MEQAEGERLPTILVRRTRRPKRKKEPRQSGRRVTQWEVLDGDFRAVRGSRLQARESALERSRSAHNGNALIQEER